MYKHIFFILSLVFIQIQAEEFQEINPAPTAQMLLQKNNALPCSSPAQAKENFDDDFRYGCFCGKKYPPIEHASKKEYKKLNRKEREALIVQYYAIKPYDDIDKLCQAHDICYLYQGKEAQVCNDTFYSELKNIQKSFKKQEKDTNSKERRCRLLASDISTVFKTVFGMGEDITLPRASLFSMITPMHIAGKLMQKMAQQVNSKEDYPFKDERCIVEK
jgi:hypothetical protein